MNVNFFHKNDYLNFSNYEIIYELPIKIVNTNPPINTLKDFFFPTTIDIIIFKFKLFIKFYSILQTILTDNECIFN